MRDNLIKRSWFTICRRLFNGCNVSKTWCTTGHLTFLKRSQLAVCWWTGVSRQEGINSVQGDRLHTVSKSVCTVKISKLIHFQSKNNMKLYVLTVVITSHTLITNEIHNWLNHVFMSLLSPLAEPADNESETDGHLAKMGPRLIMSICLIFPGPVFSQCKVANSELLLHNHTCAQLSYCFETSSRQVFHCGGKQWCRRHVQLLPFKRTRRDLFMSFPTLDRLVILTAEHVYSGRPGDRFRVHGLLRSEITQ